MEILLKTNEFEEAVSSLQTLSEFLSSMDDDLYRWKWIILALHQALQGFMVLALRSSDGLRPLKDKSAAAWLQAHREGQEYPKEELDTFLNLYKKIKSDRMLFYIHSRKFVPTGNEGRSVRKLNSLRNDFIHFLPRTFLMEVNGLPRICLDCISIIEFLGWQSGNILWHDAIWSERAKAAINELRYKLDTIRGLYEDDSPGRIP